MKKLRSVARQQQLSHLQRLSRPQQRAALSLIRRVPTRWFSTLDAVKRYLELYTEIQAMFAKGAFSSSNADIHMPRDDERPTFNAIVEVKENNCENNIF